MADQFLTIVEVVCSVIGTVAELWILRIMLREGKKPPKQRKYWPLVIGMVLVAIVAAPPGYLALRAAGAFGFITSDPYLGNWNKPLIRIVGKEFRNETVQLDGYDFVECDFHDVTFEFDGKQPFAFEGVKFTHESSTPEFQFILNSNFPPIASTLTFLNAMGVLHPGSKLRSETPAPITIKP